MGSGDCEKGKPAKQERDFLDTGHKTQYVQAWYGSLISSMPTWKQLCSGFDQLCVLETDNDRAVLSFWFSGHGVHERQTGQLHADSCLDACYFLARLLFITGTACSFKNSHRPRLKKTQSSNISTRKVWIDSCSEQIFTQIACTICFFLWFITQFVFCLCYV